MESIKTTEAALPLGHYSQAMVHNGLVYISGQLPIEANDSNKKIDGVKEQTRQALKNLDAILRASHSSKERVLKVTIFISDISIWAAVNEVYSEFFGEHKPARSAVPTKELPKGYLVEIEAIATQL